MEEITLSCLGIDTKEALHTAIAQALAFPDWYGMNLDALYDCLTDVETPTHLHLADWDTLPEWKAAFRAVLDDAENDCMELIVSYE